jgi:hypothetical protein
MEERVMRPTILIAFATLVLALPGFGQDPVGTWTGETTGAAGLAVRPFTLVLNPDGTGTVEVDVVLEVEDGVIDGNRVRFSVRPLLFGTTPARFRFHYDGEVEDDTMTLHVTIEGGGGRGGSDEDQEPLVLTRAPSPGP